MNLLDAGFTTVSCDCVIRLPPGLFLQFLSLPFTGSLDPNVTQTPGHLVKGKGQKAKMECVPIKGHSYVFWYHRKLEEEFKFLVYLQNEKIIDKIEGFDNQFSAECSKNSPCTLEIKSTEPGDSALYMCASSKATVLNVRFFLDHKRIMDEAQEIRGVLGRWELTELQCRGA